MARTQSLSFKKNTFYTIVIFRKMFLYYSNKINCKFIILLFLLAIQFYIFSEYKNPSGFFTIRFCCFYQFG
ncbi:hypothetical protein NEILACOT_05040 [Neisseria lactamica ATCC 23970]|uniref:Uncharacterized protein n=1 Tax=Neisseria lactamica ATCC 23970 TaxID=546265 RepID=D0WBW3_NEILA|nr:hypothetical protein NEILACOT_05040 [Neisseria lactamica ATCC 23970]